MAKQRDFDTELKEVAHLLNESQASFDKDKAKAKKGRGSIQIINTAVEASKALNDNDDAFQKAKSTVWPLIKDQLRDFSAYSDNLLSVLDELSKVHPFITVAVIPFKLAIKLLIARQDNDQKLIAVHCTMNEMMSTLVLLKDVSSPTEVGRDGMTIENRITARMYTIVECIKDCMKLCHSYMNRHTAIKLLTSLKWQPKFTAVTEAFALNRARLLEDLQLHVSISIVSARTTLTAMEGNITLLTRMIFELLRSQEERDMDEFIKKNGGVEVVSQNPILLDTLLRRLQRQAPDMPEKRQKDDSGIDMPRKRQRDDSGLTVTKLQEQLGVEVDVIIKENSKAFEQQCEVLKIQIDEVKGIVKRESKRTIDVIREGAHDRIRDPDIYEVWKDMGFKGSVKVRHLVMALRDHFSERQSSVNGKKETNTLSQIRDIVDPSNVTPAEGKLEEIASVTNKVATIRPEDEWALGYINVFRVQPLMEALDRDASSFVTVVEANAFAAARPPQWSLPHWLAYWTCGFELSVNWYRAHIIKLLAHISSAVNKTLPANRVTVEHFWQSDSFSFIDSLLAGFYDGDIQDDINIENDAQFLKFKDYILKQEAPLRNMLSKITFNLSDYDTFSIVLGQSRLETCILPLLHLLLQRALDILRISETVVLDDAELSIIDNSIYNVNFATYKRVKTLKDIFKLQNLDFKTQTKKFFFGMYYYYWEEDIVNGYWKLSPDTNSVLGSLAEGGLPSEESEYENYSYTIDGLSNSPDGLQSTAPQCVTTPTTESHDRPLDSTENDNAVKSHTLDDLTHIPSNEPIGSPSQTKPALFYGPSSDDGITVDNGSSDQTEPQPSDTSILNDSTHALLGQWYGSYTYNEVHLGQASAGLMSFSVTSGYTDGKFSGSGVDGIGEFSVEGSLDTDGVKFIETYVYSMQDEKVVREYRGTLSDGSEIMSGSWGPQSDNQPASLITADSKLTTNDPPAPESTDDKTPFQDSTAYDDFQRGGFVLKRRHLFWPSDPELEGNRPRTLWNLAYRVVRQTLRKHQLSWTVLKDRRDKRRKYISLMIRKNMNWQGRLEDEDLEEWANLHQNTPPEDLRLWSAMARFAQRRRILHSSLSLGWSAAINAESVPLREQASVSRGRTQQNSPSSSSIVASTQDLTESGYTNQLEQTMALKARDAPTCTRCCKPVKHPFWCCVTCEELSKSFICLDCNKQIEEAKPWQWECRPVSDPEHEHNWAHPLVLINGGQAPATQTLEERFNEENAKVHDRLNGIEASLSQNVNRFNDIEAPLSQNVNRLNDIEASLSQNVSRLNGIEALLSEIRAAIVKQ
ncbi:hypothetical protein BU17DRAFT_102075 [Hysterangium stoloniferum]|nr:hypothetical protein BU17DRAFT_102075 [Hysterangium stoloniferum]